MVVWTKTLLKMENIMGNNIIQKRILLRIENGLGKVMGNKKTLKEEKWVVGWKKKENIREKAKIILIIMEKVVAIMENLRLENLIEIIKNKVVFSERN